MNALLPQRDAERRLPAWNPRDLALGLTLAFVFATFVLACIGVRLIVVHDAAVATPVVAVTLQHLPSGMALVVSNPSAAAARTLSVGCYLLKPGDPVPSSLNADRAAGDLAGGQNVVLAVSDSCHSGSGMAPASLPDAGQAFTLPTFACWSDSGGTKHASTFAFQYSADGSAKQTSDTLVQSFLTDVATRVCGAKPTG